MDNTLTIHYHLKHFKESGLPFLDYFILLLYEQRTDWTVSELGGILSQSDRTITRMRVNLVSKGYLQKGTERDGLKTVFSLTDKLYKK